MSALLKIFQSRGAEAEFHALAISDDGDIRNSMVSLSFIGKRALRSLWKPRPRRYYKYRSDSNCTSHIQILCLSLGFFLSNSASFSAVQSSDFLVGSPFGIRVRRRKLACSLTDRSSLFY